MLTPAENSDDEAIGIGPKRRYAEQRLRLAIAQLTAILESTTDGILVTDLDKKVTRINQRFKEMWRLPQETIDAGVECAMEFVLAQMQCRAKSSAPDRDYW